MNRVRLLLVLLLTVGGCASDELEEPNPRESLAAALERAGEWLAAFPAEELRFDAAIGLFEIRRYTDGPAFGLAYERARKIADRDHDHPMHGLWNEAFTPSLQTTSGWSVPLAGEPRANVNKVVIEALHCAENGWRQETMDYVVGPMRDGGGYHTAHALWALVIAHRNGCISDRDFQDIAAVLRQELRGAQPQPFEPTSTLAVDLYAERMLMIVLSSDTDPDPEVNAWANRLLELQNANGNWGFTTNAERAYYRYHATMVASWALAAWACE